MLVVMGVFSVPRYVTKFVLTTIGATFTPNALDSPVTSDPKLWTVTAIITMSYSGVKPKWWGNDIAIVIKGVTVTNRVGKRIIPVRWRCNRPNFDEETQSYSTQIKYEAPDGEVCAAGNETQIATLIKDQTSHNRSVAEFIASLPIPCNIPT
jgi:hypothetical protein